MKRILDLGHTDLRLFFKHPSAYVWLFVVPFAFIYLMGAGNRGPGNPANRRPAVLIENADTNFLGRVLLDELQAQEMRMFDPTNRADAARVIRIPPDFTAKVQALQPAKLAFLKGDNTGEADAALIEIRLVRSLVAFNSHLLETGLRASPPGTITEGNLRAILAQPNPVRLDARFAGRQPVPSGFNFSLPGTLVMYLMMNLLLFGGATVSADRRNGVIRRLLVLPVTRLEIIAAKIYGLMLLGGVQILFFLAVGKYFLNVNLGANLPAVTLTLILFAWVAGALGVLVGSVVPAHDRVNGICILVALLMAAVGGCWWPLEIGPPMMRTLALCLPTGWALAALHQLISFGAGWPEVITPLLVLTAFGGAASLLAARWFKA